MKIHEIRELTDLRLQEELDRAYREFMTLRFRATTNQLPNSNLPRLARRSIARLRTVLRERSLAGS